MYVNYKKVLRHFFCCPPVVILQIKKDVHRIGNALESFCVLCYHKYRQTLIRVLSDAAAISQLQAGV
jgi:hypothetical protein